MQSGDYVLVQKPQKTPWVYPESAVLNNTIQKIATAEHGLYTLCRQCTHNGYQIRWGQRKLIKIDPPDKLGEI